MICSREFLLYPLMDRTGDPRYKTALDRIVPKIYDFPKTEEGGFWHMRTRASSDVAGWSVHGRSDLRRIWVSLS